MRFLCLLLIAASLSARDVRVRVHGLGVITLDLESYISGVLMGEASVLSSPAAMQAMAIAARTFAVRYSGRHSANGFDFCETTHCQDLRLKVKVTDAVRSAVEATENELLWFEGKPAAAYYGRHCGGQTASGSEIWPDLYAPYLRSSPDTFCAIRGPARWHCDLPVRAEVLRRSPSGRVAEVRVNGRRMGWEEFQRTIGESFGWNLLRSNRFELTSSGSGARADGAGNGHGVGLCQIGADERGKAGHSPEAILSAYYPGTTIGIAAAGLRWQRATGERVDVFSTDESSLRELVALGDRLLAEAEQTTGMKALQRPAIRAYPSISVYRDATGSSGRIAATTAGRVVRLQPPALLRSRGALKSTVFHELLHVVVETNAHPSLPAWFREDVVQQLSSGRSRRSGELFRTYGRERVLSWIVSGVPPFVSQSAQTPAASRQQ